MTDRLTPERARAAAAAVRMKRLEREVRRGADDEIRRRVLDLPDDAITALTGALWKTGDLEARRQILMRVLGVRP